MDTPIPSQIKIRRQSACLELQYDELGVQQLSFEFLRVYSPSAEVQGHGPGTEVLQHGKQGVMIEKIEPVGNYGLKFFFSDKHDSGIYTWQKLVDFCENHETLWEQYLQKLEDAGLSR